MKFLNWMSDNVCLTVFFALLAYFLVLALAGKS